MRGNLGHQLSPNTHRTTLMSDADYREVRRKPLGECER
jgi:hypothetical protein